MNKIKKQVLLIITGSIAAYKSLDLIRLMRKENINVTCVLTKAGEQFVTELSVASLSESAVYKDVFSLKDEVEMGHIRLSRESDLIVVAPASADIIAKMAGGFANDLASTILLATNKPVLVAPAMNVMMWQNKAVARNVKLLKDDGINIIGPASGDLACGEQGLGRMTEVDEIFEKINKLLA
jgi:phosphopantothenoylcysteine decarboxylase / phosphopantothenate---cysteine ligase